MMRVVGYVRVSTEEQATDGVSLAAQRAKLTAYAALYDLEVVAIVEDAGVSAKTLDRPGLARVLAMVAAGEVEGVLVAKLDRLTRSVRDLGDLLDGAFAKAALLSVGEQIDTRTAAGRLVLNILGSVAQWEREAIGERTSAALQHKRARGERVGAVPYGYRVGADGVALEADPAEQEVITVARDLVAGGLSLNRVATELASRGYAPRSGGQWYATQIKRMVAA
jgi:DNA invertase Pin-like site-specific DNA recombinase